MDSTTENTIVVGVDGSEPSRAALRWALEQAQLTGSVVRAVVAWEYPAFYSWEGGPMPPDEFQDTAAQSMNEAVDEIAGDTSVQVEREVVHGHSAQALLDAAEHARLLVEHLPSAEDAIGAMVAAVRPGGWLVVEDLDWSTVSTVDPPSSVHERVLRALRELFDTISYDPCCGRTLPRALRRAGLDDVGFRAEPRPLTADRERGVPLWEMFVDQLAPHLLGGGLMTDRKSAV